MTFFMSTQAYQWHIKLVGYKPNQRKSISLHVYYCIAHEWFRFYQFLYIVLYTCEITNLLLVVLNFFLNVPPHMLRFVGKDIFATRHGFRYYLEDEEDTKWSTSFTHMIIINSILFCIDASSHLFEVLSVGPSVGRLVCNSFVKSDEIMITISRPYSECMQHMYATDMLTCTLDWICSTGPTSSMVKARE